MTLSPGNKLGPYEIRSMVGAGGMGEVYRARDTRLDRDVAVKILPSTFSADADRLRRFEQEARAAAALNHPNILAVYDIGYPSDHQSVRSPYIVTELLEGSTLRERLVTSDGHNAAGLPLRKAIEYAIQIARGLAAAHERGIVHRDLKPENVFVTTDGRVKILDFGLAKLSEGHSSATGDSNLPTMPPNTSPGVVLGTVGYMAPEQVRGQNADHRVDIFGFGAILYEMCAGRRAFQGETSADTLAAILDRDPPDQALTARQVPPALARMIERCLEKNPAARFQTTSDLAFALEGLAVQSGAQDGASAPPSVGPAAGDRGRWRQVFMLLATLLVGATAAGIGVWQLAQPAPVSVARFEIAPPDDAPATTVPGGHNIVFSPDGSRILYQVPRGGSWQLFSRRLDEMEARPIAGTEGAVHPFFSPDSNHIGFVVDSQIKRTPISGGPVTVVCRLPEGANPSWGHDENIYFSHLGQNVPGSLFRVPAAGGIPEKVAAPAPDSKQAFFVPHLLPDGDTLLFHVRTLGLPATALDDAGVAIWSLKTGEYKLLLRGGIRPRYLPSGHLVYATHDGLMAAPYDLAKRELAGPPVLVFEGTVLKGSTGPLFGVSDSGSLVYFPPTSAEAPAGRFIWVSRQGTTLGAAVPETLLYPRYPRISPDGHRLTATVGPPNQGQIWIYDLTGRTQPIKLTFIGHNTSPVWSPDGTRIAYDANGAELGAAGLGINLIAADGSAPQPAQLYARGNRPEFAADEKWMLVDGGLALGEAGPQGQLARGETAAASGGGVPPPGSRGAASGSPQTLLWLLNTHERRVSRWLGTGFLEVSPRFSPSGGDWVAYITDSTGAAEVWVRPFPGPGAPIRVSNGGGRDPVWSRDGKQLFYQADGRMMAADVAINGGAIRLGRPYVLFEGGFRPWEPRSPGTYDVAPDGRFLMITPETTTNPNVQRIAVVLNWSEELKRMVSKRD